MSNMQFPPARAVEPSHEPYIRAILRWLDQNDPIVRECGIEPDSCNLRELVGAPRQGRSQERYLVIDRFTLGPGLHSCQGLFEVPDGECMVTITHTAPGSAGEELAIFTARFAISGSAVQPISLLEERTEPREWGGGPFLNSDGTWDETAVDLPSIHETDPDAGRTDLSPDHALLSAAAEANKQRALAHVASLLPDLCRRLKMPPPDGTPLSIEEPFIADVVRTLGSFRRILRGVATAAPHETVKSVLIELSGDPKSRLTLVLGGQAGRRVDFEDDLFMEPRLSGVNNIDLVRALRDMVVEGFYSGRVVLPAVEHGEQTPQSIRLEFVD